MNALPKQMKTVSPLLKREMNDKRHFELPFRRKVVIVYHQNCLSTELFVVKIVCRQNCLSPKLFVVEVVCCQTCLVPEYFVVKIVFLSKLSVARVFCRQCWDHLLHFINTNSESC